MGSRLIKRAAAAGFLFFFVKGLVWLAILTAAGFGLMDV